MFLIIYNCFYCTVLYVSIDTGTGVTLKEIFSFWTGLLDIPPLGMRTGLEVDFLPDGQRFCLPQANACFARIKLPTIHTNAEIFTQKMDQAIGNSLNHFGLI